MTTETYLTPARRPFIESHARAIRAIAKRVAKDIVEIGRRLVEVKRIVGHGFWLEWLDKEFGWTDQTARNFIHVFELVKADAENKKFLNLNLPASAVYLIAQPNTPPSARDEIAERAEAGEAMSTVTVQEIIANAKAVAATDDDGEETAVAKYKRMTPAQRRRFDHESSLTTSLEIYVDLYGVLEVRQLVNKIIDEYEHENSNTQNE